MDSEASCRDLHCSVCRQHIAQLPNLRFPACRHLFCSACFDAHMDYGSGLFQCPIDYCGTDPCSDRSEEINTAIRLWKENLDLRKDSKSLELAFERVQKCVNFLLVPCGRPSGHSDFASCPYDHSLYTNSVPLYKDVSYCRNCRVVCRLAKCPRCGKSCDFKRVTKCRSQAKPMYRAVTELPYVKLRC